jgi:hypothetical protein
MAAAVCSLSITMRGHLVSLGPFALNPSVSSCARSRFDALWDGLQKKDLFAGGKASQGACLAASLCTITAIEEV